MEPYMRKEVSRRRRHGAGTGPRSCRVCLTADRGAAHRRMPACHLHMVIVTVSAAAGAVRNDLLCRRRVQQLRMPRVEQRADEGEDAEVNSDPGRRPTSYPERAP